MSWSMSWSRVRAILAKDIGELAANRLALLPMIVVPLVITVVLPSMILALGLTLDVGVVSGMEQMKRLIPDYPVPPELAEPLEQVLFIFLNYTFIPLFLLVPIMAATVIAANAVVGEKERRTLETLLYTPVTHRELVAAKLLGAFLPAVGIGFLAFAGFFAAANAVSLALRGYWIVRSWIWLPTVLLLSPAVSLVGLAAALIVSLRAKTFMEAQQAAGMVVVPFIALLIVQIAGLVTFRALYVVLLSLALFGVGLLLLARVAPRFTREGIIRTL